MAQKIISCLDPVLIFSLVMVLSIPEASAFSDSKNYQALTLYSNQAIVVDQSTGKVLYEKNADAQRPIASITKLMTAMVTLDAKLPMQEKVRITEADVDTLRNSRSRLKVGPMHSRRELLQLALMSSENRAASALSRSYPGGRTAFINAMNRKAKELGMLDTHFEDATGLHSGNVSTAKDLVKLVQAGFKYSLIRQITTTSSYDLKQGTILKYKNTNPLFKDRNWQIGLSKTGYIKPAGHCLVMQTEVVQKPLIIVLLDADARGTVSADSNRIKRWLAQLFSSDHKMASADGYTISKGLASATDSDASGESAAANAILTKVRTRYEPARPLAITP